MTISEALRGVGTLFIDSAPVIYFVENHPRYFPLVKVVFEGLDNGLFIAVTSPIPLAECLVGSVRRGLDELTQAFWDLLVHHHQVNFVPLDAPVARSAAELRARYNLTLPDAFQVAVALKAGCDALLTNDAIFKRVRELKVLLLDELEAD